MNKRLVVKNLGRQDYEPVWKAMHTFTDERDENTCDEVWLVEHNPVFTQGQAGKEEHVLAAGDIPIVKSDRGGQVTYHGPGQLVAYVLINLRRKNIGVRELVTHIENTVINTLSHFNVESAARPDAPGVYVDNKKICSLGLRIRKGCSFHGLALNINMDLSPFLRINPCGYAGMEMTQLHDLVKDNMTVENKAEHVEDVHPLLIKELTTLLDYTDIEYLTESSNHE
ncbi:lipoyl(octanoyl) transferase LipB [Aliivibrio fischeri]|uniref:lipoyl(octanoyl) transferase LipB n=1 Tax=Aliivibrio fischeri TaxID=668 RepID=UPI00080E2598|nr:lipoyl(octanoyl) transferase LipB [Aliivibrio fischeri]MCE4936772.1 lipoyl(octanoyl) transferase LipB [Aliivibrio fischeri]OCH12484.1 octanoyltransferase [Aliivibrio fischeri]OCH27237.1 octanoyltransferase [Aliivibrio fischeri]